MSSDSSTTNFLLDRSIAGDPHAFAQLFGRYEESLRQLCRRRIDLGLVRRFDLSDVIQETRLEAFRRLQEFARRKPSSLAIWLQRTALEQLTDLRQFHVDVAKRSIRREQPHADRSSEQLCNSLVASNITPSGIVSAEEESRRVRIALSKLKDDDREILLMRYVEQHSNREAAYLLGVTDAAASQRHGMALLRLRRTLRQLYPT